MGDPRPFGKLGYAVLSFLEEKKDINKYLAVQHCPLRGLEGPHLFTIGKSVMLRPPAGLLTLNLNLLKWIDFKVAVMDKVRRSNKRHPMLLHY